MEYRVAAILTNYNMPERTDALVKYIRKHVKAYPADVVVVDNGSDLCKPSRFTNVWLKENIQTTGGWLAGLASLKQKYFAYWFLITSAEFIPEKSFDPLMPMVAKLKDDPQAVGIHNALTQDSTTSWGHLITRGGIGCRPTWMLDNISSLYRAEWFDSIGWFDPNLIYGWGIDLETCYLARQEERTLWICEDAKVKKVTDIGYTMDRMNMTADDRRVRARENMMKVFEDKYGEDWRDLMYGKDVDESLK
jgi:GT2 family glycosyltransferase